MRDREEGHLVPPEALDIIDHFAGRGNTEAREALGVDQVTDGK